jgi:hypothetical protein
MRCSYMAKKRTYFEIKTVPVVSGSRRHLSGEGQRHADSNRVLRLGGRGVWVAAKSSFAFNEPFSTRTFCKPLILPIVGLLSAPPRILVLTEISRNPAITPELAELPSEILSLHRRP